MIGRYFEVTIPLSSLDGIKAKGLPEDLARVETARAKEAVKNRVPIYTGIEAVVTDTCSISPYRVREYVRPSLDGGVDGIRLSWDARWILTQNLRAVGEMLNY